MPAPPRPDNDERRVAALRSLDLLHTPPEERFDRITRLAQRLLGTPMAAISLIDDDVHWFKSRQGVPVEQISRSDSFCAYTILDDRALVVEDASRDPRFADNPLVTGGEQLRFYAGHPIRAIDGSRVGALCVLGDQPRVLDEADRKTLEDLAALVESELHRHALTGRQLELLRERDELRRRAMTDGLTGCWNREALLELLAAALDEPDGRERVSVAMIDVDDFKRVNDTYGHPVGDQMLREIAARLRAGVRAFDPVGRYGGEEFAVVLTDSPPPVARGVAERMRTEVRRTPVATTAGALPATVSVGVASVRPAVATAAALVAAADAALYRAKAGGRDRVEAAPD